MNKKIIAPLLVAGFAVSSGSAVAQSYDFTFKKQFYIGLGGGQSTLEPDTSAVPGLDVTDDKDSSSHVILGFDFARRLTAELQYAQLGTAGLSDGDGIEYSEVSLSGLYYLWNGLGSADYVDFDGLDQRTGLSLYARLGVGRIENEALQTVQFERQNSAQLMAGLGIEYGLGFGLGLRAEITNYDTDAKYVGMSLLYRVGGRKLSNNNPAPSIEPDLIPDTELPNTVPNAELPDIAPDAELPTLPAPAPIETLPPPPPPPAEFLQGIEQAPVTATVVADSDNDGVVNEVDGCPSTLPGTPVDSSGCAMFNGVLDGVNFLPSSDTLTETSRAVLDEVVNTLYSYPDVRVSVQAHTDSQGPEEANRTLSRNRAVAVVRYLTAQGITLDRLEARAFGETQPIADNTTRAGRLLNRRVEFRIIQ